LSTCFVFGQAEADLAYEHLKKTYTPLSSFQLLELLIKTQIEERTQLRIYSPEFIYYPGEKIIVFNNMGKEFVVEVINVSRGRKWEENPCDYITLKFPGESSFRTYIANCPEFPLRFDNSSARPNSSTDFKNGFSLGNMVNSQFEVLAPRLRDLLVSDGRFAEFHDLWFLKDLVVPMDTKDYESILSLLKEKQCSVSSRSLIPPAYQITQPQSSESLLEFSVNYNLHEDKHRRFAHLEENGAIHWYLAPPARVTGCTLTDDLIQKGCIRITTELQKMLDYYKVGEKINFITYGSYEIQGNVDTTSKSIWSKDIKQWLLENDVRIRDKIYVKAPEESGKSFRLFTKYEQTEDDIVPDVKTHVKKKYLRHLVHELFVKLGMWLHVKSIQQSLIEQLGEEVARETIEAILSSNDHLFIHNVYSRGLWGLREWAQFSNVRSIDQNSLLLAIGKEEEDFVYQILNQSNSPLTADEIAEQIAERYGVPKRIVLETNFIDPSDDRIIRVSPNKWGLSSWVKKWKTEE
jgi:hypothetical protein